MAEREAVSARLAAIDAEMDALRTQGRELLQTLKDVAPEGEDIPDPATVDRETAALIRELRAHEAKVKELQHRVKERMANDPEVMARTRQVQSIQESMRVLRQKNLALSQRKLPLVARLRELGKELKAAQEAGVKLTSISDAEDTP